MLETALQHSEAWTGRMVIKMKLTDYEYSLVVTASVLCSQLIIEQHRIYISVFRRNPNVRQRITSFRVCYLIKVTPWDLIMDNCLLSLALIIQYDLNTKSQHEIYTWNIFCLPLLIDYILHNQARSLVHYAALEYLNQFCLIKSWWHFFLK